VPRTTVWKAEIAASSEARHRFLQIDFGMDVVMNAVRPFVDARVRAMHESIKLGVASRLGRPPEGTKCGCGNADFADISRGRKKGARTLLVYTYLMTPFYT
jgi:hypothetical protein